MNKNYLNKPVFTFVRNPYSRAVSLYFECLRDSKHHKRLNINSKTNFFLFRLGLPVYKKDELRKNLLLFLSVSSTQL